MNTPPTPPSRLLPLAALVSLLVFLLAAIGLFALSSSNRHAAEALARLSELRAAQIAAVEAQVSFKTQVQEWKNILLRGRQPSDYQDYLARFTRAEAAVQAGLRSLEEKLGSLGLERGHLAGLRAEHNQLGSKYRQALSHYHADEATSAFAVDASIRGIDRQLNAEIDALAHTVEDHAREALAEATAAGRSRYATLRKVLFGGSALAVLAALGLVAQAARAGKR